jgi:hypothetical protein
MHSNYLYNQYVDGMKKLDNINEDLSIKNDYNLIYTN